MNSPVSIAPSSNAAIILSLDMVSLGSIPISLITLIVLDATFPAITVASNPALVLSYTALPVSTNASIPFFILLSLSSLSYLFLTKPVTVVFALVTFAFKEETKGAVSSFTFAITSGAKLPPFST